MAEKYIKQNAGNLEEVEGQVSSAGAGDTGKIVALNADGKIDDTMLPVHQGVDSIAITVEDATGLTAGDMVNIFDSTGTAKARKTDASNGRIAHGFVKASYADAVSATVYKEGSNTLLTGMTPGADQFLSGVTPGAVTETPPTTATHKVQKVGVAFSATDMDFEAAQPITLA